MKGIFKIATAVTFGLLVGGGAVQVLHAQSKPPAFVVAEIAVRDQQGLRRDFLKPTPERHCRPWRQVLGWRVRQNSEHYLELPRPNRVVILEFANMDTVKKWQDEGAMDMENTIGSKYASFRIYAVEGAPH